MAVQTLEDILREQNPSAAKKWDSWEANLKPKSFTSKGHRGMYGNFEGFIKSGDPNAIAKAQAVLDAQNKKTDTPTEMPTTDTPVVETQVGAADAAISRRRGRSSTILTGVHGDGGVAAPQTKKKSLLGSFSA